MKKILLIGLIAMLSFWAFSCDSWITTTTTLTYVIDTLGNTEENFDKYVLDLATDEDYAEHRDQIRSVDQISFVGFIVNNNETVANAELWVDTDTMHSSIAEVEDNATLVFTLPEPFDGGGVTTWVNWEEGLSYMENTEYLEGLIMDEGTFAIYAMADDPPFDMEIQAELVVTLTLGQ
ncbi:MAG: hypothetical protein GY839_04440 [candidate division Zixibacteria bacterium]|nr:hypothetical protein [candidate division Zixibacteria bacterium]